MQGCIYNKTRELSNKSYSVVYRYAKWNVLQYTVLVPPFIEIN